MRGGTTDTGCASGDDGDDRRARQKKSPVASCHCVGRPRKFLDRYLARDGLGFAGHNVVQGHGRAGLEDLAQPVRDGID